MRMSRILREGIRSLGRHKTRTFFMMTGTLVGIGALTVILAFGKGSNKKIMKRVRTFGPNAIMLIAGGGKDLPPPDMKVTTLTVDDADAVRESIPGVKIVSPMAWSFGVGVSREGKQTKSRLWGVEPSWHKAWRIHPIPEPMWRNRASDLPLEDSFLFGSFRSAPDASGTSS